MQSLAMLQNMEKEHQCKLFQSIYGQKDGLQRANETSLPQGSISWCPHGHRPCFMSLIQPKRREIIAKQDQTGNFLPQKW